MFFSQDCGENDKVSGHTFFYFKQGTTCRAAENAEWVPHANGFLSQDVGGRETYLFIRSTLTRTLTSSPDCKQTIWDRQTHAVLSDRATEHFTNDAHFPDFEHTLGMWKKCQHVCVVMCQYKYIQLLKIVVNSTRGRKLIYSLDLTNHPSSISVIFTKAASLHGLESSWRAHFHKQLFLLYLHLHPWTIWRKSQTCVGGTKGWAS